MSKLSDLCDRYEKELVEKCGIKKVDRPVLNGVAKACGPSLYKADATKVACSNKEEMARVKQNFLIKKLGLKDTPKLDEALAEICAQMGSKNRNKYRAMFYYLLVKKFKKSKMFSA
jgi:uncharacterized protein DUF2853